MAGWLTGTALLTAWVSRPGPCQLWPIGAGPCAKPGLGLGIGEVHDDEAVVLAEHQVVGLKLAPRRLHRLGHHRDPVAWLLHGPGDGLALEVKNTAYFDIAAPCPNAPLRSLHRRLLKAMRPPLD